MKHQNHPNELKFWLLGSKNFQSKGVKESAPGNAWAPYAPFLLDPCTFTQFFYKSLVKKWVTDKDINETE